MVWNAHNYTTTCNILTLKACNLTDILLIRNWHQQILYQPCELFRIPWHSEILNYAFENLINVTTFSLEFPRCTISDFVVIIFHSYLMLLFFTRWGHDVGQPVITIDTSPVVNTTCGYIQGQIENGIYVFKVQKKHRTFNILTAIVPQNYVPPNSCC